MKDTWQLTLFNIQEKLRRDENLTPPESRWLAWELVKILQKTHKNIDE